MSASAELTAQLRSTLARMECALSLVQDGIVWTDHDGEVLWCNEAFDRLAGGRHIDILGTRLVDWVALEAGGEPLPAERHPVSITLAGRPETAGTYDADIGGEPRVLAVFGRLAPLPGGLGAVFVFRDETERATAEREMRKLNARLEAANTELEAFSYSVSHDLRTPLRAIAGFSQALVEDYGERLDAVGTDYLHRVRAAAQRMGELIDAVLQLSRATRTALRQEEVSLSDLARRTVEHLRSSAPQRRVDVRLAEGLVAHGDPSLLGQVLDNLLSNAWKFTENTPEARIELGSTPVDGETVFFVRDNGAGFDMAYADRLFGAFQRLHSDKEFAGTGIGLATVRRIVHRHGGRVWAEAAVGEGATFHFTLPTGEME